MLAYIALKTWPPSSCIMHGAYALRTCTFFACEHVWLRIPFTPTLISFPILVVIAMPPWQVITSNLIHNITTIGNALLQPPAMAIDWYRLCMYYGSEVTLFDTHILTTMSQDVILHMKRQRMKLEATS